MKWSGLRGSDPKLLRFIRDGRYPFSVLSSAVEYLHQGVPPSREAVRAISDVAESRFGRLGKVHQRLGLLLHDLAEGLENQLNRPESD